MKTVRDILRDADPLRHEPQRLERHRDRLRRTLLAAAADVTGPTPALFRRYGALVAAALIVVGVVVVGWQMWSRGDTTLQAAAIRFEVRLAEAQRAAGLSEARIAGSNQVVYLHREIIVTNGDISQSRVVPGDGPSRFGVGVEFNAEGAEKMRQSTMGHVGRPLAILIDSDVVTAPVLRSPIGSSAVISGDYTKAEADRIVNGIRTQ
jgi:preprotein translocase subunit SecD